MPQTTSPVDDYQRDDGPFVQIAWQRGPIPENGVNGCQPEVVIHAALARLRYLNGRLPCRENSLAITKLEEAIHWIQARTASRIQQQVEGTEQPHL